MFEDITQPSFAAAVRRYELDIPNIPNINHWFRFEVPPIPVPRFSALLPAQLADRGNLGCGHRQFGLRLGDFK